MWLTEIKKITFQRRRLISKHAIEVNDGQEGRDVGNVEVGRVENLDTLAKITAWKSGSTEGPVP